MDIKSRVKRAKPFKPPVKAGVRARLLVLARRLKVRARVHMAKAEAWRREHQRPWMLKATVAVVVFVTAFNYIYTGHNTASALSQGDALITYGVAANTTPQVRTYSGSGNTFAAAGNTVAGAAPGNLVTRTSPTKQEAITGYVDAGTGTLRVMCYDGTSWTNEWNVAVGGTATTRRFDIAYETNSGDVMVLYSGNVATTNELVYRTKAGSTGCGSGNWSGATNLDSARITGTVGWVKMAWDRRPTSNLITAVWVDSNARLSAMQWSGTAWGNEPSAALETSLECLGGTQGNACAGGTVPPTDVFDVEYESLSGDVMVTWGSSAGTATVNGAFYALCNGGTSSCTWVTKAAITSMADDATVQDISANPYSDEIVFASIGDAGSTLQANYWDGTAWTTQAATKGPNLDTTSQTPLAGTKLVATGWTIAGGVTRSVIAYNDAAAVNIGFYVGDGSTFTLQIDQAPLPAFAAGGAQKWYDIQMDPYNRDRLMMTVTDSANGLFAKRLVMTSTPVFTWTDSNAGAVLDANLGQATVQDFSFAYWRLPAIWEQKQYHWYDNADSVQPTGTGLGGAAENAAATISSRSTISRLRMNLKNTGSDLPTGFQDFKLQYATSTSGPWTDVVSPWCNTSSPTTCNTNWQYRKKITFDNSDATGTLANFTVMVKLSTNNFNFANARSDGFDVAFTDSSGASLNYEREKYDGSTIGIFWVKVPSIPNNTSSYIQMYYGNAGASSDPVTTTIKNNSWDTSYKGVWHLSEDPSGSAPQMKDSTSSGYNGTSNGTMGSGARVASQIGDGLNFNGTNQYISIGKQTNLYSATASTISCWFNDTTADGYIFNDVNAAGNAASNALFMQTNKLNAAVQNGAQATNPISTTSISTNTWAYGTTVWSGSNTSTIFVNGVPEGSAVNAAAMPSSATAGTWAIGQAGAANVAYFPGKIDECRYSNVARTNDWIFAEYLNGANTFSTYGLEQTQGGGVWKFYNNPTPVDGSAITANLLSGSTAAKFENYTESNPTAKNLTTIAVNETGEWDFVLDPALICNGIYYFRVVKADGTALTTYTTYPQITVNASTSLTSVAPLNMVMHHGGWFQNESKQVYSCDWVSPQ